MLAQLFPHLYEIRFRLSITFLLIALSAGCSFITPCLFKVTIDTLFASHSVTHVFILVLLCGYGACWTVNQLMIQARTMIMYAMLERTKTMLSEAIFDKLLSLTTRFHGTRKTGELTSAIEKAQYGLDAIFWGVLLFFIPTTLEIVFMAYIIGSSCGMMHAGILILVVLLYSYGNYRALSAMTALQADHNNATAQVTARFVDILLNIETVKYFAREHHEHARMSALLQRQESCAVKRWTEDAWLQLKQMLILGIGIWVVTVYTGYQVYTGHLTLGTFILINTYLLQCIMPLSNIGYVMHQVRRGVHDMALITELLQERPEIEDPHEPYRGTIVQPQVTFQHVSFGYTSERTILHDITFSVRPGQTLAIVGPSGSGKSTIAQLIPRMYDVASGAILLNGVDIRTMPQRSLRTVVGIVSQNTLLFNATLYENIAYGDLDAPREAVYRAAERAQLGVLLASLPQGYETVVGERGLNLSGGERQRIAIARVLLKNPLLYIFDEATSSLDSSTEQEIQKHVRTALVDTTTIIIAHRLSTITHADQIIVLDQGRIVERGTHEQLLQRSILYTQLWNNQQQEIVEASVSSKYTQSNVPDYDLET